MNEYVITTGKYAAAMVTGTGLFGVGAYWCVMYHLPDAVGLPMLVTGFFMFVIAICSVQEENNRRLLMKHQGAEYGAKIKKPKVVICWDMDGVLAVFKKEKCPEDTKVPGYFYRVQPDFTAIFALFIMFVLGFVLGFRNMILSSAWQCAKKDKTKWLWKYGLGLVPRTFVPVGEKKFNYVNADPETIYILIDDNSELNLFPWKKMGLVACKYYNGINGTKGTWASDGGYSISRRMWPWEIVAVLLEIIETETGNYYERQAAA